MNTEIKLLAPPKGKVFRIPEENLDYLYDKIAKLNGHAEKAGCVPVKLDIISIDQKTDADSGAVKFWYNVYVEGEAPKIKGWTFLGALTHAPEGNIIRLVPGKTVPQSYWTSPPKCDYCHKDWIVRRDTYILQNDKGEYKQVGGNCLADFLGHPDPFKYANYAEAYAGLDQEVTALEKESSNVPTFTREDLKTFLAEVAAVIDQEGWVSRGAVYQGKGGLATADLALDHLHRKTAKRIYPSQKNLDEADKVISYMRVDLKPENDYQQNLKTLTSKDVFTVKEGSGIVASAVPYYRREMEKQIKQAQQAKVSAASTYIGTEGERLYDVHVTVIGQQLMDGGMYQSMLIRMIDDKGNILTWFGVGQASSQMETGKDYTISATVKKHQEYKGTKQTLVTRVKLS